MLRIYGRNDNLFLFPLCVGRLTLWFGFLNMLFAIHDLCLGGRIAFVFNLNLMVLRLWFYMRYG